MEQEIFASAMLHLRALLKAVQNVTYYLTKHHEAANEKNKWRRSNPKGDVSSRRNDKHKRSVI